MRSKKILKRLKNYSYHQVSIRRQKPVLPFDNVFVIGCGKTGTSSVRDFLKLNGLKHLTINRWVSHRWNRKDYKYLDLMLTHFNSFDDRPWNRLPLIERYMSFPGDLRFLLTYRDPEEWFFSMKRYNEKQGMSFPQLSDMARCIGEFQEHYERCHCLAKRHSKKMLRINVTKDSDVHSKILDFLDLPTRNIEFPHSNRTQ